MTASSFRLDISLVTWQPDRDVLGATLATLATALRPIGADKVRLYLIDNGPGNNAALLEGLADPVRQAGSTIVILTGHGNIGYGAGHDLAILADHIPAPYHLVLNPDVELAPDTLERGLAFLDTHPSSVMVAPRVEDANGHYEYLCKRKPGLLTLALRGFAPRPLRRLFRPLLNHYEMRDILGPDRQEPYDGISIASGCFMLMRSSVARRVGGFGDAYFLYFEDFDLSLRLANEGTITYRPDVRIVHHGGGASRKGLSHIRMFVRSAITFFRRNSLKVF